MTVMEQAEAIREAMDVAGAVLTDEQALGCKAIYKQWKDLIGVKVKKGYRFLYDRDLYRTEQPEYTFVEHYVPGSVGTESIFSHIDVFTTSSIMLFICASAPADSPCSMTCLP